MAEYFNRDFTIQIGPRIIRARPEDPDDVTRPTLRVIFEIEKTLSKQPNKAKVTIYNLSDDSRSAIQESGASVILEAGYVGSVQQIFKGDLLFASTVRQGPDWVTEFQSGDGALKFRGSRISETFPKGATIKQVAETAAECLGVELGNLKEKLTGENRKSLQEYARGKVLQGRCSDEFDKVMSSIGLKWSIQDGAIQALRTAETNQQTAIVVGQDSGMVGSPEVGEKGVVTVTMLLQGRIIPGSLVDIQSKEFQGLHKVLRVTHSGDSWGGDWYTEFEAKSL